MQHSPWACHLASWQRATNDRAGGGQRSAAGLVCFLSGRVERTRARGLLGLGGRGGLGARATPHSTPSASSEPALEPPPRLLRNARSPSRLARSALSPSRTHTHSPRPSPGEHGLPPPISRRLAGVPRCESGRRARSPARAPPASSRSAPPDWARDGRALSSRRRSGASWERTKMGLVCDGLILSLACLRCLLTVRKRCNRTLAGPIE